MQQPGGAAGRWIRAVVTFGVGAAIGLAPFLGLQKVPLFTALLEMIPTALRPTIIPVSAALMGIIAVSVQWYGGERLSARRMRRIFPFAVGVAVLGLIGFLWMTNSYVVTVRSANGERSASFVISAARVAACQCPANVSDSQCIDGIGWTEAAVAQCWGDRPVRQNSLVLQLSYLLATASFAFLVAMLVLKPNPESGRPGRG